MLFDRLSRPSLETYAKQIADIRFPPSSTEWGCDADAQYVRHGRGGRGVEQTIALPYVLQMACAPETVVLLVPHGTCSVITMRIEFIVEVPDCTVPFTSGERVPSHEVGTHRGWTDAGKKDSRLIWKEVKLARLLGRF